MTLTLEWACTRLGRQVVSLFPSGGSAVLAHRVSLVVSDAPRASSSPCPDPRPRLARERAKPSAPYCYFETRLGREVALLGSARQRYRSGSCALLVPF